MRNIFAATSGESAMPCTEGLATAAVERVFVWAKETDCTAISAAISKSVEVFIDLSLWGKCIRIDKATQMV